MNKRALYQFSLELRKLIEVGSLEEAENKISEKNLSKEEISFVFKCLNANGYDPENDLFMFFESDNSAFLKLVNIVEEKIIKRK